MKLAIDFDNTVVDSHAVNVKRINEIYDLKLSADQVDTTFYTDLVGKPREEESDLLYMLNHKLPISNRPAVEGVSETAQELFSEGHHLNIVSARPDSETELVRKYCDWLNIPYEAIYCVDALYSGHDKKAKLCKELGLEVLIDDQIGYLESCTDMLALLFTRPWNKNIEVPEHVIRVNSWFSVREVVDVYASA